MPGKTATLESPYKDRSISDDGEQACSVPLPVFAGDSVNRCMSVWGQLQPLEAYDRGVLRAVRRLPHHLLHAGRIYIWVLLPAMVRFKEQFKKTEWVVWPEEKVWQQASEVLSTPESVIHTFSLRVCTDHPKAFFCIVPLRNILLDISWFGMERCSES